MEEIIHCTLRIHGVQAFLDFDLFRNEEGKLYAKIGADKQGKPIIYFFDSAQIIPDRGGRTGHFENPQEIVLT